MKLKKN